MMGGPRVVDAVSGCGSIRLSWCFFLMGGFVSCGVSGRWSKGSGSLDGGCVSLFILRLADQKGYMLLGDCFFSPQGCDVDVGCIVCLPCSLQRERVNLKELRGEIVAGDPLTVGTRGARS